MRKEKGFEILKETMVKLMSREENRERICGAIIEEAQGGNMKAVDVIREILGDEAGENLNLLKRVSAIKIEVVDAKENKN